MEVRPAVLKDLNLTPDEIDRFTKAFKDDNFRKMLHDYAQEISDPENKKKYEEEIKRLEEERGIGVEFIHPQPFRALRTKVNGKQKCYINICANDKVDKPECKREVSENGQRGQQWSLPHTLHPGREDRAPKGSKFVVYDVVFHPDTLHIARKNKRFMDIVINTAIQGIQDTFNVILDKNLKEMSIPYKGRPQPCLIRKPIPGFKTKQTGPLGFPYPDEDCSTMSSTKKNTDSPTRKTKGDPKIVQTLLQKTKEPTEPHYTVKYRSFIDLQDFRFSRDSAQSPRPKEIVVTVDVPLLTSVADTSLEVNGRNLMLEAKEPAYRLEVVLAYPVDEDKGQAKFNKQRGQLTVTLPVLASNKDFDFTAGLKQEVSDLHTFSDDEELQRQSDKTEIQTQRDDEEEQKELENGAWEWQKEQEGREKQKEPVCSTPGWVKEPECEVRQKELESKALERQKGPEYRGCQKEPECEVLKWQKELKYRTLERQKKQMKEILVDTEEKNKIKLKEHEMQKEKYDKDKNEEEATIWKGQKNEEGGDEENMRKQKIKNQQNVVSKENAAEEKLKGCQNDTEEEVRIKGEQMWQDQDGEVHEGESNTANLNQVSSKEPSMPAEELVHGLVKEVYEEDTDEDDLKTQQHIQTPQGANLPPAFLREIDTDGNVKTISDHTTSAGFTFQNTLLYQLD
ncbi:protein kintoun [Thalassophryne amazonica]|uniref:protein kintoun n=1 Tax=Thalassophryne amazonica TaxID=390379 RepID=UPI0014711B8F|nr:protein kintoun [Thalassophryne amazonica]XP_034051459.1 protein kintoun [Thalassophryne amazonica]